MGADWGEPHKGTGSEIEEGNGQGEDTSWGQRIDVGAGEQRGHMWDSKQGPGCTVRPPRSGLM